MLVMVTPNFNFVGYRVSPSLCAEMNWSLSDLFVGRFLNVMFAMSYIFKIEDGFSD